MRFSPRKFDRHLNNIGQDYLWKRSFSCACVNVSSGAPNHRCPICLGKGVYWSDPVTVKAATAGQNTQMKWAKMGLYEAGDIVLTVQQSSPLWDAGQNDIITMLNGTDRFSQPLHRGASTERFIFDVVDVDRVFWIVDGEIVEGGIPAIAADGAPIWAGVENTPPMGAAYSISGTKRSAYFIYQNLPRNRNMHSGFRLPKMTVIRRLDLLRR